MNKFTSHISINSSNPLPVYRQIYRRIKDAIVAGSLKPDERLPSMRVLASDLGLARGTIESAYAMLISEGYIESRGQSGTRVSGQLRLASLPTIDNGLPAAEKKSAMPHISHFSHQPLQLGLPALDEFPLTLWNRLAGRQVRQTSPTYLAQPPAAGYRPLREAIARYLQLSRGITCQPRQIFICGGYSSVLRLIIDTLYQHGDRIWLEDPCYLIARQIFTQAGAQLVPIDIDNDGINVELAIQRQNKARFALVTPAHHSPTGVTLSLSRRLALLAWATERQSWIIEDDYDGEFRYQGHPLPALKSLDTRGRVLYAGTFSKVLFPALRTAYLVVPESLVEQFEQAICISPCTSQVAIQGAIADFIDQSHFYRHLKNMRTLYARRRSFLIQAIEESLGHLKIETHFGGMHLILHLEYPMNDKVITEVARKNGLAVEALSHWSINNQRLNGLLLGFTNISSLDHARQLIHTLSKIIQMK
ncbi:MocR-like pyridoxine biosynthesis transcription factor PdxR [Budvicia aquatica]|uniref:HTH-type transcriptional regulatory protein gabR n=1 Tax=Budvicia aquatica TaxID=82979 RepID=A0A2C6DPM3_9GAMM|nr:PLP-dependent aminotransferase family protein [Budvicia aquatica]PHI32288.1 PLP-dependent aminotransferase family protein [Budvicia aquatica]VFS45220.1 HTH-type transcriptional regulatory protein gabR [Budvicia aquatica]